ncbi:hypothetical protein SAMN06295937_104018 [Sphingopyxis flava]|uniref:Uncharacterized protein n=1 Tax=Sphingopyxis flava TaxID=1507287 RepID=A0A1T5FN31_9SPHN|nr:hypothetical protein SAMN06295937_104018 [Sphingopyxis flava]
MSSIGTYQERRSAVPAERHIVAGTVSRAGFRVTVV